MSLDASTDAAASVIAHAKIVMNDDGVYLTVESNDSRSVLSVDAGSTPVVLHYVNRHAAKPRWKRPAPGEPDSICVVTADRVASDGAIELACIDNERKVARELRIRDGDLYLDGATVPLIHGAQVDDLSSSVPVGDPAKLVARVTDDAEPRCRDVLQARHVHARLVTTPKTSQGATWTVTLLLPALGITLPFEELGPMAGCDLHVGQRSLTSACETGEGMQYAQAYVLGNTLFTGESSAGTMLPCDVIVDFDERAPCQDAPKIASRCVIDKTSQSPTLP